MDEVRLYNRTLSPGEVSALYNWAPGPVMEWKLDENTGTTAFDSSSYSNNGTVTNATWTTGKFGAGLNFDGDGDLVTRADDDDLDFTASQSFTIEAWIKHSTASALQTIVEKYESVGADGGYILRMESDGDITFGIDDANGNYADDTVTSTAATYDDNSWHHVVGVKNGTSSISLYIDGEYIGSDSTIGSTSSLANDDPLYVGIAGDGASNDWNGQIDNIVIYNYARTPQQIVKDLNAGHPTAGSPIGSQLAYWKFDEMAKDTAYDSVGSTNGDLAGSGTTCPASGTNACPTWTTSGKFNSALSFSADDTVKIGDPIAMQLESGEARTYTAWIKTSTTAQMSIVSKQGPSSHPIGSNVYTGADGKIYFSIIGAGGTNSLEINTSSSVNYSDNNWHHIAVTYDGSKSASGAKIYVDGISRSLTRRL